MSLTTLIISIVQDCDLEVSKFKLQSYYCVSVLLLLGKSMKPLITSAIDLVVSLLFFYKDALGIK